MGGYVCFDDGGVENLSGRRGWWCACPQRQKAQMYAYHGSSPNK